MLGHKINPLQPAFYCLKEREEENLPRALHTVRKVSFLGCRTQAQVCVSPPGPSGPNAGCRG